MRSEGEPMTRVEAEYSARMEKVLAAATETLGSKEKAAKWLETPNRALGGGRPLDRMNTDSNALEVETLLGRIDHGIYS